MEGIGSRLWELERQFWLGGGAVYRQYLTEHALMGIASASADPYPAL